MKYKTSKEVPMEELCERLDELADAVTKGGSAISREFFMGVPARVEIDADLVICEAARRLREVK